MLVFFYDIHLVDGKYSLQRRKERGERTGRPNSQRGSLFPDFVLKRRHYIRWQESQA